MSILVVCILVDARYPSSTCCRRMHRWWIPLFILDTAWTSAWLAWYTADQEYLGCAHLWQYRFFSVATCLSRIVRDALLLETLLQECSNPCWHFRWTIRSQGWSEVFFHLGSVHESMQYSNPIVPVCKLCQRFQAHCRFQNPWAVCYYYFAASILVSLSGSGGE